MIGILRRTGFSDTDQSGQHLILVGNYQMRELGV